jgi:hypothetical protein
VGRWVRRTLTIQRALKLIKVTGERLPLLERGLGETVKLKNAPWLARGAMVLDGWDIFSSNHRPIP